MRILGKTTRFAAIATAALFIEVSFLDIFSRWFIKRKAADAALKGFGLIEAGVWGVDTGSRPSG